MNAWIAGLPVEENARPLVIPVSCSAGASQPSPTLLHLKGAHWPDDREAVLNRIGVWLGMRLLPGAQKIFISYKTSDGAGAAITLEAHLRALGYRVFRDASRDNVDGTLNIQPGDDLHEVLARHVRDASAVVLLDTPEAPQSAWIHEEVKVSIGRRIPALPVVFRAAEDAACGSRFRRLKELHRFVPIPLRAGEPPVLDAAALDEVAAQLERFLLAIAQRRRACIGALAAEFAARGWSLDRYGDFHHLFEAARRERTRGRREICFSRAARWRTTCARRPCAASSRKSPKRSAPAPTAGTSTFTSATDLRRRRRLPSARGNPGRREACD